MKDWLTACSVPNPEFWTRNGVDNFMPFLDPLGNVIELPSYGGLERLKDLQRGPTCGLATAIDIDTLRYRKEAGRITFRC